jgi:predicted nucleic acid-binding protein
MVRLEILRGARSAENFQRLRRNLGALTQLPGEDAWDEAARLAFQLHQRGVTVQSTDVLIAAVALRAGATVLHRDRDFDAIARHSPSW